MGFEERVSAPKVLQASATATGNGNVASVTGYEWLLLTVSGVTTATIVVEGQLDDSNWETLRVMAVDGLASATSISANNTYIVRVGGQRAVRARISSYTAGTIVVTGVASAVCPFPVGYGLVSAKYVKTITVTPVLTTTPYSVLDSLGGELTLSDAARISGGAGVIQTIILADKGVSKPALDIVFFNANPAGTYTNNAAVDVDDADLLKIIGTVEIAESEYVQFTNNCLVCKSNVGIAFTASGSADIYALIVARGTPTYAVGDVQLLVSILQD